MVKSHARWGPPLLVAFASILPYLVTLGNGFVWDDHPLLESNPALARPFAAFGELLVIDNIRTTYYRPLEVLRWSLLRVGLGLGPAGFHAANVLLHAAASVLVLLIARRLLAPGAALLAGLLFAVHPVHVEAVAFAGTNEVFPSVLFLGGLLVLLPAGPRPGGPALPGAARVWAAAALWLLAALAKETGALAFAVGLVVLASPRGGAEAPWPARLRAGLPLLVSPAVYLAMRLFAASRPDELVRAQVLARDAGVLAPWLFKVAAGLVLPLESLPYHSLEPLDGRRAALLGLVLAAGVLAPAACRRALPSVLPLAVAGALLLVPLAAAAPFLPRSGALFAERFLYLPSAGICLLAACAAATASRRLPTRGRAAAAGVLALLLVLAGARTRELAGRWRDDATLFGGALALDPENLNLLLIRANQLLAAGDPAAAEPLLLRIEALKPGLGDVRFGLARVAQAQGRIAEARAGYRGLLGDARLRRKALLLLGYLEAQAGEDDLGEGEFTEALRLDPRLVDAHLNLGELAWRRGDRDAARGHWERGLAIAPDDAALLYDLGLDAQERGDFARARALYRRALSADPGLLQARRQLEVLPPAP